MPIRFACLLLAIAFALQGEEPFVGHVIRVVGKWQDKIGGGTVEVKKGYAVKRTSQLQAFDISEESDLILVRSYNDNKAYPFPCNKYACGTPLNISVLIPTSSGPGTVSAFVRGLNKVLADLVQPEKAPSLGLYATTLSKGGESPQNAIVPLLNGSVDLQQAFAGMPAGVYLVELCPMARNGAVTCPDPLQPSKWTFQGTASQAYRQPGLRLGLYELRLYTQMEAGLSRVGSAPAVLLASAATVESKKALLQDAIAATADWGTAESTMALRAYMQSLVAPQ